MKRNCDSTGGTQQAGELSALGEHSRPSTHADRVQLGLENWGQVHRGAGTRPCKVAEAGVRMAARRGRTMLGENGPKPRSCTRHRDHQGSALPWLGPHPGAALGSKWSRSDVSDSTTPWTVALQAPPSMGFSRQENWSGLPFPSPGDLPDPGIEPGSPALQAGRPLYCQNHQGSPPGIKKKKE